MNPLANYPKIRKALYNIQWVSSGLMLLIAAAFAASQTALPAWYAVVSAVLSALWAYTGITASSNINQPEEPSNGPQAQ